MTRLRGGACPALSPPSGQTPQTPVRVRKEPGLPAPPARGPAGPHSPAQRTPRSPCPQRRCHQKDKFPRVADLQKMISFLKIFSTWPLVPNDRKSHAVGSLRMNLQRPQSQPTSPPRGEGPRPFLVNTGGRGTAWQRDLRLGPSCPLCKSGWSSRRAPGILELIAHLQLVAATCNPRTPHQAGVTPRPLQKANTAHPLRPRRAPSPSLEGKRNTPCAASGPKARKRRTLTSGRQARRRSLENPFVHRCIRSSIRQIFAQRRAQCPPGSSSRRPQRCRGTWRVRGRGRVAWEMTRGA